MKRLFSGIMLTLLLTSMLVLAFKIRAVKASGTIYLRADGSIDPAGVPIFTTDNSTYFFTENINGSVAVERSNIVIDGLGHTLNATLGNFFCVRLESVNNVTVRNTNIVNSSDIGVFFYYSTNNTLTENNVMGNRQGIVFSYSSYNVVEDSNITENVNWGLCIQGFSSFNTISANNISNNLGGINSWSNSGDHNTISNNRIAANTQFGIYLYQSQSYGTISENEITSDFDGMYIWGEGNSIWGNNVSNNANVGIWLWAAACLNNTVYQNVIENNFVGIRSNAIDNKAFHNNFVHNIYQVLLFSPATDSWDNSYPSGGNYWSDYTGIDVKSGSYQNETGNDGIGDTPYVIDSNNQDNYPLMTAWKPHIDWWSMFQHDPQHTGCSTEEAPDTNRTLWIYQTGGSVVSSPAVVDGRVFVGSWDWCLHCLDSLTGELLWRQNVGGWVYSSSPAVADGIVYVGSMREYGSGGSVFALNATTGSVVWSCGLGSQQRCNLNVYEGILYVGAEGAFYAFNSTTGSLVWSMNASIDLWESPAISEGVLYLGDGLNMTALDAAAGTVLWTRTVDTNWLAQVSPTFANGIVFIATYSNGILALNATNGETIWAFPLIPGTYASTPAISDGRLFVTRRYLPSVVLNATTGESLWNFTLCSDVASSPAVADGKVFFGACDGNVYALDEITGEVCWTYQTGERIVLSSPAIVDGKLYIGSFDGRVFAFGEPHSPIAIFAWEPQVPRVGESVIFDASISIPKEGKIAKYEWDFGDGGTASGETVAHVYYETGIHTVILNVTDSEGLWDVEEELIEVGVADIAITSVTLAKAVVEQGGTLRIDATIQDQGIYEETFNVTLYVNATSIGSHTVTLTSGSSKTITFAWNTAVAKSNYTIWIYAEPVPGELDQADNNCTGGWVQVTIFCDVNGDGSVDMADISLMIEWFMSSPPNWNPNCDVNNDLTIDMADISLAIDHFMEVDP